LFLLESGEIPYAVPSWAALSLLLEVAHPVWVLASLFSSSRPCCFVTWWTSSEWEMHQQNEACCWSFDFALSNETKRQEKETFCCFSHLPSGGKVVEQSPFLALTNRTNRYVICVTQDRNRKIVFAKE
jgi:hypothetical protein